MSLDINTPNGAITLLQEQQAVEIIKQVWPGSSYIETPKDTPADVDAIMSMNDVLKAVAQTSCRQITLGDMQYNFRNEWLLTFEKLLKGRRMAMGLQVEYWGLIYLVPDAVLLRVKMFTPQQGWLVKFRIEKTMTRATVNGGTAIRDNAFIDVSGADIMDMWGRRK